MSLFKKNRSHGESNSASAEKPKLVWGSVLPGRLYEKWPKTGGEPEPPAFLVHRSSLNLEDEMLVQMLEAPAMLHEICGQPVQQSRMQGRAPAGSEVGDGGHEAAAKMPRPHIINRHAGGQRMIAAGQPMSEGQPPA